jgi:hypothetical protein
MTNEKKKLLMEIVKKLKFSFKYVVNFQRKLEKDGKFKGFKSHDYHIIMQ